MTYLQPFELAYNAAIEQGNCWWRWRGRSWCVYYTPSTEAIRQEELPATVLCKELPYLNGNIGPRRGMCTREDLLSLNLQEGCWYNLRSRKALEDSKGHTTKFPLATNKTAAWMHAWLPLWRSGSCVIDSVKLRRGRDPEGMGRMVIRTR